MRVWVLWLGCVCWSYTQRLRGLRHRKLVRGGQWKDLLCYQLRVDWIYWCGWGVHVRSGIRGFGGLQQRRRERVQGLFQWHLVTYCWQW